MRARTHPQEAAASGGFELSHLALRQGTKKCIFPDRSGYFHYGFGRTVFLIRHRALGKSAVRRRIGKDEQQSLRPYEGVRVVS